MAETPTISAVILSKNNARSLERALQSVQWCDARIVLDDNSTDDTQRIALKYHAEYVCSPLSDNYAKQRNYGLTLAHTDWIFFLDTDEYVPEALMREIRAAVHTGNCNGYMLKRTDIFMQKKLHHGETGYARFLRLAKRDTGYWQRPVHETWSISGKIGTLKHSLMHTPHDSISSFLDKIIVYTTMEAQYRKRNGERFSLFKVLVYPVAKFFVNYILKRGFLDGFPGLAMAYMMSLHSCSVRVHMYEK